MRRTIAVLRILLGAAALLPAADPATEAAAALAGLRAGHPRLLLTDTRLGELKRLAESDAVLRKAIADVIATADRVAAGKPLERVLVGPRLLKVSRDCLGRELALGLAWRLTAEPRYLAAARRAMDEVCAFRDWNPSHFLDVAEMSNAVAIGLDWCWAGLAPAERERIRAGLVRHGLDPGIAACGGWDGAGSAAWWCGTEANWNQVCHGGLLVAALAVADSDPRYAARLLPQALRDLPHALAGYDPDGSWPEGPGYWAYATDYTVFALSAMDTALGTTCGLEDRPGLRHAGAFLVASQGPTGLLPNFADVGDRSRYAGSPLLYWFAHRFHQPELAAAETAALAGHGARPLDVAWYEPAAAAVPALPLDQRCEGPVALAMFRSAWNDPDALYAYIKGGYNQVNHGHLDLGSFEFDCLGQRWARDLGSDNYDLPGYFSGGEGGKRWSWYRTASRSHSVPLVDDQDQAVSGRARIAAFAGGDAPHAVVDLGSAYPAATRARRGLALVAGRRALLVQDEFVFAVPHQLAWAMTSDATIAMTGDRAELSLGGRRIAARILAPAGAAFSVESAERQPPEKANAGVSRLIVRLPAAAGEARIAVLLGPAEVAAPAVVPLERW